MTRPISATPSTRAKNTGVTKAASTSAMPLLLRARSRDRPTQEARRGRHGEARRTRFTGPTSAPRTPDVSTSLRFPQVGAGTGPLVRGVVRGDPYRGVIMVAQPVPDLAIAHRAVPVVAPGQRLPDRSERED